MTRSCSKCNAHLESQWGFCPHCGGEGVEEKPQPQTHEAANTRWAFSGLVLGFVAAPAFIIYGTMICLLGPPMVLGIPLIVIGILAPFAGPYLAINAVHGKCPWCGTKINSIGFLDAFFCYACSKPIVVKKRELYRGDDPVAIR